MRKIVLVMLTVLSFNLFAAKKGEPDPGRPQRDQSGMSHESKASIGVIASLASIGVFAGLIVGIKWYLNRLAKKKSDKESPSGAGDLTDTADLAGEVLQDIPILDSLQNAVTSGG